MTSRRILILAMGLALATGLAAPPATAGDTVDVLIAHPQPYDALTARIEALGGTVRYGYRHIDAVAATVPRDMVDVVKALPAVTDVRRDDVASLSRPPVVTRPGFGDVSAFHDLAAADLAGAPVPFGDFAPTGYFPTEVALTGALDFWTETSHYGEGVIIGVMDTGVADVAAIAGRVLGGESFLWLTPAIDDGLGPNDPANGAHGTWVATTAGADVAWLFSSSSTLAQSLREHLPESIVPDYIPGVADLVPMVGQAPAAEFYALKVFNVADQTSNAVLLAAFDRAIELKQLWDAGDPAGVNLQVLNGSWSGASLYSADDPYFAAMIAEVQAAGIVVCLSAANDGPSALTIGDPGLARNTLTVGGTSIAAYEKVLRDLQFGLGTGALWRANDTHQTIDFSSRGPTADGRYDPDITAPGFAIFVQGANGSLSLVSGTSFSSPMVAGAAALLLSAAPDATPDEIRAALLTGADPDVLEDFSGPNDQGFGFLDVMGAYTQLLAGAPNPADEGVENRNVDVNARRTGVEVVKSTPYATTTGWLVPGQTVQLAVETAEKPLAGLTVFVDVDAELPPGKQNELFGDDVLVAVHSAKTSGFGDYRAYGFVGDAAVIPLGPQDLEAGLTRVTVMADSTNAGRVQAEVTLVKDFQPPGQSLRPLDIGRIADGESIEFTVDVPAGLPELDVFLTWKGDWLAWPTNDLDVLIFDPDGNLVLLNNDGDSDYDGLSLDVPERVTVPAPAEGTWTLIVDGFTIWEGRDTYYLFTNLD